MRVAIISTSYPVTEGDPSGHFVRAEARELVRQGDDVVVIAPGGRSAGDGIDVIPISSMGAFGWPGAAARLRAFPLRAVGAARWMTHARAALVQAGPFSRILCHWAVPSAWPIAAAAPAGAEIEVVSHGADVRLLLALPRSVRARMVGVIAERACRWRFVSKPLRDGLVHSLPGQLSDQVSAIAYVAPSVIDMPDVRGRSLALRAAASGPFVCSVGRLIAGKRIDLVLLRAAEAHPEKELIVVGDGPERGNLERLARRAGVKARFIGLQPRDEALAWLCASEALLFASQSEGRSTVVREAEALGVRVEFVRPSEGAANEHAS